MIYWAVGPSACSGRPALAGKTHDEFSVHLENIFPELEDVRAYFLSLHAEQKLLFSSLISPSFWILPVSPFISTRMQYKNAEFIICRDEFWSNIKTVAFDQEGKIERQGILENLISNGLICYNRR